MEMESIPKKRQKRLINRNRFMLFRLILPIIGIVWFTILTMSRLSENEVISIVAMIPGDSNGMEALVRIAPVIYPAVVLIVWYLLFLFFVHTILHEKEIVLNNYYYDLPSWMLICASYLNHLHEGSATSIPIWQFCEYLYNRSSFGWRGLSLTIPDVMPADSGTEIKQSESQPRSSELDLSVLTLVISDTYPVSVDQLPQFVKSHRYRMFQTLENGKIDRVRRYNPNLVSEIVESIREAETGGVKSMYLILNTNPRQVAEIFREGFCDADRNPIEHLFVYGNGLDLPSTFTTPHRIF